jgi:hypothetical protein
MKLSEANALALVQEALRANAIRLIGSHLTESSAEKHAKSDAMYLLTLLKQLCEEPGAKK